VGKNRLEAVSDGVIAVIITILVLEPKVLHGGDFQVLVPLWPVFMSYVLSFIYVGIYWNKFQYANHPSGRRCAVLGALGLAALVSACTPNLSKADETLQIQQAVLRYQFEHNAAAKKYAIFCIAISKGETVSDAPAKLIQSLNDAAHKVVKSSDCNAHMDNGVTERSSGKPALMLNVGQVNWLAKDEAVVEGGYYEAGLSSSGNTYHLKMVSGVWRVVQNQLNWIS
jgi:hypothetical protein